MKKSHIAFIVVAAVLIAAMVNTFMSGSTYASFDEAFALPGKEFHVVGELDRDQATVYNPQENPDLFVFHMIDEEGRNQKVFLHRSKPQDFERSEKIVLIGKTDGDEFHAKQILMKCPSKYEDGEPEFKTPEELETMDS